MLSLPALKDGVSRAKKMTTVFAFKGHSIAKDLMFGWCVGNQYQENFLPLNAISDQLLELLVLSSYPVYVPEEFKKAVEAEDLRRGEIRAKEKLAQVSADTAKVANKPDRSEDKIKLLKEIAEKLVSTSAVTVEANLEYIRVLRVDGSDWEIREPDTANKVKFHNFKTLDDCIDFILARWWQQEKRDFAMEYQIIINRSIPLYGMPQKEVEEWLKRDGYMLRYITQQTEGICKLAVQHDGRVLQYVHQQTEAICKLAVQQDGLALQYVHEQTEEICKFAVKQNGLSLRYVRQQTEEICRLAVQQDGLALQYVHEQTEEICRLAVQQDSLALQYVRQQTEEICRLAIERRGATLQYAHEQTEALCKLAVQQSGYFLRFVHRQSKEVCQLAVWQDGGAIRFVADEFYESCVV